MTTPKPPTPRTPAKVWEALVQEAGEDEIAAASALSEKEAEAYLRAQGFDVEAEKAKGEEFLASLEGRERGGAGPR